MLKCGTDGGFKLNDPLIDGCGSFKYGNDQLKLNFDRIALIAFPTAVFAALIGVVIAVLIAFHVEDVADFTLFHTELIVDLIPLIADVTADFAGKFYQIPGNYFSRKDIRSVLCCSVLHRIITQTCL